MEDADNQEDECMHDADADNQDQEIEPFISLLIKDCNDDIAIPRGDIPHLRGRNIGRGRHGIVVMPLLREIRVVGEQGPRADIIRFNVVDEAMILETLNTLFRR